MLRLCISVYALSYLTVCYVIAAYTLCSCCRMCHGKTGTSFQNCNLKHLKIKFKDSDADPF